MRFSIVSIALSLLFGVQVQKMEPDYPKSISEVSDETGKVFAVDSYEKGPIRVVHVEEVKQQNPPSLWAVSVQNRGTDAVTYRMTAAVVTGDNKVKGSQLLQTVKNLQSGKISRQQIKIFPTILNPTDRVVFYLNEISTSGGESWKVDKDVATALVIAVATRHPVK